jgi:nucleotidyltransferase substrate binding protein (TIGR01987 family)
MINLDAHKQIFLAQQDLQNALVSLEEICNIDADTKRINIDATIQRFKYSTELFWIYLKQILQLNGIEVHLPKAILQESLQNNLIDNSKENERIWFNILTDGNQTSNCYNKQLADEIYSKIKIIYAKEMQYIFNNLSNKSGERL